MKFQSGMSKPYVEMAEKEMKCEKLLCCVFGLKELDIQTYMALLSHGPMRVEELEEKINRERSTAYRSLQNLIMCKLAYREMKSIEAGGYYYVYRAANPEKVKGEMKKCIDAWHERVIRLLDEFESKYKSQPP